MDRPIVYTGEIALGDDFLLLAKNTMIAIAKITAAVLGTNTIIDGLACVPDSPASLHVSVGPGSIFSLQNIDSSAYGDLAADTTHQIVKNAALLDATLLPCAAPATTGNSIAYLIQAAYQDQDTDAAVLPYFNASIPDEPFAGPANSGVSQNKTRKGALVLSVKAGVSATTGTQVPPAADAGFTGLWVVTVANGATTITSGNIVKAAGAPFLLYKLPDLSPSTPGVTRTQLTNDTTYHVATTGNDSTGDGSSGTPWATLQHAINFIWSNVDLAGFTATISIAAGTYTGGTTITGPFTGGGSVVIQGNGTCILSNTANALEVISAASITTAGLTLTSSAGSGLRASAGGVVTLGTGMEFGACFLASILCEFDGLVNTAGNGYTVSGTGGQYHVLARKSGNYDCSAASSATVTISGTPNFTVAFVSGQNCGVVGIQNYTWSGSITSGNVPYSVTFNGVVNGVTGLPGSGAPVQSTGGQFS